MGTLILLRHGQSTWNLENRFTGWIDVPLTEQGMIEAAQAGEKIKIAGIHVSEAFTSVLKRAIETLTLCLRAMGQEGVPTSYSEALNERHYGDLQGLNKAETAEMFGQDQVKLWRRSYDIQPPNGESLKDTAARTLPYFSDKILPAVQRGGSVLVSAHGNSLRAIVMDLDQLTEQQVIELNIPNGVPIVYEISPSGDVLRKHEL